MNDKITKTICLHMQYNEDESEILRYILQSETGYRAMYEPKELIDKMQRCVIEVLNLKLEGNTLKRKIADRAELEKFVKAVGLDYGFISGYSGYYTNGDTVKLPLKLVYRKREYNKLLDVMTYILEDRKGNRISLAPDILRDMLRFGVVDVLNLKLIDGMRLSVIDSIEKSIFKSEEHNRFMEAQKFGKPSEQDKPKHQPKPISNLTYPRVFTSKCVEKISEYHISNRYPAVDKLQFISDDRIYKMSLKNGIELTSILRYIVINKKDKSTGVVVAPSKSDIYILDFERLFVYEHIVRGYITESSCNFFKNVDFENIVTHSSVMKKTFENNQTLVSVSNIPKSITKLESAFIGCKNEVKVINPSKELRIEDERESAFYSKSIEEATGIQEYKPNKKLDRIYFNESMINGINQYHALHGFIKPPRILRFISNDEIYRHAKQCGTCLADNLYYTRYKQSYVIVAPEQYTIATAKDNSLTFFQKLNIYEWIDLSGLLVESKDISYAFKDCTKLRKVSGLPYGIEVDHAFDGCNRLIYKDYLDKEEDEEEPDKEPDYDE